MDIDSDAPLADVHSGDRSRVALIFGNSEYMFCSKLDACAHDFELMQQTLRDHCGFNEIHGDTNLTYVICSALALFLVNLSGTYLSS